MLRVFEIIEQILGNFKSTIIKSNLKSPNSQICATLLPPDDEEEVAFFRAKL